MQDLSSGINPELIRLAIEQYAQATADGARPQLYEPLTFLLAQVRRALHMDVAFVSRFIDQRRVFEVVSSTGEDEAIVPGASDPLLDTYCQRIVDGRLPLVIPDSGRNDEARQLAVTQRLGIRAYLSAPVILPNGSLFGTVCCISRQVRADLRQSDAELLRAVADAVAASVDRGGKLRYASWTTPDDDD